MTKEQYEVVTEQARQKRVYLESKLVPSHPVPGWLQKELNFVADHQTLADSLYKLTEREKRKDERIKRLSELIHLFESAFNQIMKTRPALVHWSGKLEAIQARPLIFFHLARMMPDRSHKNQAMQFYHEYTNELITGRTANINAGTNSTNGTDEDLPF
jgi:hypothetical protein